MYDLTSTNRSHILACLKYFDSFWFSYVNIGLKQQNDIGCNKKDYTVRSGSDAIASSMIESETFLKICYALYISFIESLTIPKLILKTQSEEQLSIPYMWSFLKCRLK